MARIDNDPASCPSMAHPIWLDRGMQILSFLYGRIDKM